MLYHDHALDPNQPMSKALINLTWKRYNRYSQDICFFMGFKTHILQHRTGVLYFEQIMFLARPIHADPVSYKTNKLVISCVPVKTCLSKMWSLFSFFYLMMLPVRVQTLQYADMNSSVVSSPGAGGGAHLMCNYCNYTSPKRYLLARHLKAHSEERPHKCTICSRMFKTIPALQNHVNTHTGVRPQHCKVVGINWLIDLFYKFLVALYVASLLIWCCWSCPNGGPESWQFLNQTWLMIFIAWCQCMAQTVHSQDICQSVCVYICHTSTFVWSS